MTNEITVKRSCELTYVAFNMDALRAQDDWRLMVRFHECLRDTDGALIAVPKPDIEFEVKFDDIKGVKFDDKTGEQLLELVKDAAVALREQHIAEKAADQAAMQARGDALAKVRMPPPEKTAEASTTAGTIG